MSFSLSSAWTLVNLFLQTRYCWKHSPALSTRCETRIRTRRLLSDLWQRTQISRLQSVRPKSSSTGHGGVGNMSSPSQDPQKRSIKEKEAIKEHQNSQLGAPVRTTPALILAPRIQTFSLGFQLSRGTGQFQPFSYS